MLILFSCRVQASDNGNKESKYEEWWDNGNKYKECNYKNRKKDAQKDINNLY
ncbi:Hypothetical protein ORPV_561 [Orpheovirus IHUMI-LCC2]|uniref:Uncharacterized protein n=1 Tax=Orpheovirus IHUMI-LCC2 TaxID=2023057 RepID=A0A2I2L4I1_9VIRU|nr:Hypothetical protein ORPV_561 [Orpheovirus IHUMI-LCC2]SNW62465.1 Hypothetical protein ORPV_561 [Orpheovirus IHUMI-LCC2]